MTKIRPQEGPQWAFLETAADVALYGGAAGAGKTYALILEPLRHINKKGFEAIIFRRTSPEITGGGGLWDESLNVYSGIRGSNPKVGMLKWAFPAGSHIAFSHMEYTKHLYAHQGHQFAFIAFDQLEHFTEHMFWYMLSRNRTVCGVKPYVRATINPDPDSFVRQLISWYLDKNSGYPIQERSGGLRWFIRDGDALIWGDSKEDLAHYGMEPKSFTFIAARLDDNKILMEKDPSYETNLKALPYVERERLLCGNWNVRPSAGLYFQRHFFEIIDKAEKRERIVRAWDRAGTREDERNDPDWTAGIRMSQQESKWTIEDLIHLRESPHRIEQTIINAARRDGPETEIALFQDPGSAGKWETKQMASKLSGYRVHIITAASTKGKIKFAEPFSSQCEAGNVQVQRGSWNEIFFKELENFPEGAHDDIVDACSLAFSILSRVKYCLR